MTKNKTFVTIFPNMENVHLVKDVGQIPYFMYKTGEYDGKIITYRNDAAYPFLDNEVKGLNVHFLNNLGRIFGLEISVLKYLLSHASKIDILHLFHFKKENAIYLLIYKVLNPAGKAYVKLDIDLSSFKKYNTWFTSGYFLKNVFFKSLTRLHIRLADLFSVENKAALMYVQEVFPDLGKKLIYIPNGVDDAYVDANIRPRSFFQKENIILYVGRIGTRQKNTELFLEALEQVDLGDWKVYLIGSIEKEFEAFIDAYFLRRPDLADKITFTGVVTGRNELFEWYNKAKVLCLTSRWEGFPLTFPEALYFGNYIITTPVAGSLDITDNELHGRISPEHAAGIAADISAAIVPGYLNEHTFNDTRTFATANFTWRPLIRNLCEALNKV